MDHDEGPSPEDIERFDHETGYCNECGAEVYDLAPMCPECGASLADGPSSRPPIEQALRRRMITIVAIVAILALIGFVLLWVL